MVLTVHRFPLTVFFRGCSPLDFTAASKPLAPSARWKKPCQKRCSVDIFQLPQVA